MIQRLLKILAAFGIARRCWREDFTDGIGFHRVYFYKLGFPKPRRTRKPKPVDAAQMDLPIEPGAGK